MVIEYEADTVVSTPYCDYQSHSLVLQLMSDEARLVDDDGDFWIPPSQKIQETTTTEPEPKHQGIVFKHTQEYYEEQHDERVRMKGYRGIKVTRTVPEGVDAEILANPFRFLNLSEDSTFGQTRAAYIILSKLWHPDVIRPENKEQFQRIFGYTRGAFPIDKDPLKWFEELEALRRPEVLSSDDVAAMDPAAREGYLSKHEAYRAKEHEYEKVKEEMRKRALGKMVIVNKAFEAAKNRFSESERSSLSGFIWDRVDVRFEAVYAPGIVSVHKYDVLELEGDGRIERRVQDTKNGSSDGLVGLPYLSYDFGDVYLNESFGLGNDYRQILNLKEFFTWMNRRVGNELSPNLIEDLVTYYGLDIDRAEQLRHMIMNGETDDFIVRTLKLVDPSKYIFVHHALLHRFLDSVYNGPTYAHMTGSRMYEHYPLGVEIRDGSLLLRYEAQRTQGFPYFSSKGDNSSPAMSRFTPADFKIMQVLAYGPMLQA